MPEGHEEQKDLKTVVLAEAKKDKRLMAASIIAQEMRAELGENWNSFMQEPLEVSQKKIEGTLDPAQIIRGLTWEQKSATPEQLERVKRFLENWINQADATSLSNFVLFVSGNRFLGETKITVNLYDSDKSFFPCAHACDSSLDLSRNYLDESAFRQKLETAIAQGPAGSAFQNR